MKPLSLPTFVLVALLAPAALLFRLAVLVPLGALFPHVRRLTWQRFSALAINPEFRRRPPEGDLPRRVFWLELGGMLWSWVLIGSIFAFGWKPLLVALAIFSVVAVLNQLRTLVAHLWENEGDAMTVTAQFLDSVNVPPPGRIAELWAPVGLRYHALHHLMPSMPTTPFPKRIAGWWRSWRIPRAITVRTMPGWACWLHGSRATPCARAADGALRSKKAAPLGGWERPSHFTLPSTG